MCVEFLQTQTSSLLLIYRNKTILIESILMAAAQVFVMVITHQGFGSGAATVQQLELNKQTGQLNTFSTYTVHTSERYIGQG